MISSRVWVIVLTAALGAALPAYAGPAPNLVINDMLNVPAQASSGDALSVSVVVENTKAVTTPDFRVGVYLTTENGKVIDAVADIGLLESSQVLVGGMPPGPDATRTLSGFIVNFPDSPAVPDVYYVIAFADDATALPGEIIESIEDDNQMTRRVTVDLPDLQIASVSTSASAVAGETFVVSFTVTNQASATTNDFNVGLYLSIDTALDAGDVFLGSYTVAGGLDAASSASPAVTVGIPSWVSNGDYYAIAYADYDTTPDENETDEANNVGASAVAIPITDESPETFLDVGCASRDAPTPATGIMPAVLAIALCAVLRYQRRAHCLRRAPSH